MIRTGSLSLNASLYQIQKISSPGCICGHPCETIQHFLLLCPLYQNIRHELLRETTQHLGLPQQHQEDIIHTLVFGPDTTTVGDGRELAALFQGYIMKALALRRTAGAAAGGADA